MRGRKRKPTRWNRIFGKVAKAAHRACRRKMRPGTHAYKKCVGREVKANLPRR